jgi:hypothetical protein
MAMQMNKRLRGHDGSLPNASRVVLDPNERHARILSLDDASCHAALTRTGLRAAAVRRETCYNGYRSLDPR